MQGFRRAFVITGFVVLGLGSNLAWHYPRPEALGMKLESPQSLMACSQAIESAGVRCRPNADWSDLLVESSEVERAQAVRKSDQGSQAASPLPQKWETPPDLLADLARLPGVKEANVIIQNGHQAVVMLSMQHGAFAGDRKLLEQATGLVQAYRPEITADSVKLMDGKGADLNYSPLISYPGKVHPLQPAVQSRLDGLLGPHQALFFCRLQRAKEQKIHLQSMLYLQAMPADQVKVAQELVDQALQSWVDEQNACLKTQAAWQVQAVVYPYLGEGSYRAIQRNWRQDRNNGLTADKVEVKPWNFVQRTLPREQMQVLRWGLISPSPTPGQLALGLSALAPALFGWCLLVPWLWRRHQLSPSANATL